MSMHPRIVIGAQSGIAQAKSWPAAAPPRPSSWKRARTAWSSGSAVPDSPSASARSIAFSGSRAVFSRAQRPQSESVRPCQGLGCGRLRWFCETIKAMNGKENSTALLTGCPLLRSRRQSDIWSSFFRGKRLSIRKC